MYRWLGSSGPNQHTPTSNAIRLPEPIHSGKHTANNLKTMADVQPKKRPRQPAPLSLREIRLCQSYIRTGNALGAYKEAGYPYKNDSQACKAAAYVLKKPQVNAYLNELRRHAAAAAKVTIEKVYQGLASIAFADRRDLYDARGRILPPDQWPDEIAAAVERVESDELFEVVSGGRGMPKRKELKGYTRKVWTAKRTEALKVLAQLLGALSDAGSNEQEGGKRLVIIEGIEVVPPPDEKSIND